MFAVSCAATLYIHFWRLLPRNGILRYAKFSLRPPSLALSRWQRYCTAIEQWASAKVCGVEQRTPPTFGRATITLGIGPHSSYKLESGLMPNVMAALPNVGGVLCSTPQTLADAHYSSAVQ